MSRHHFVDGEYAGLQYEYCLAPNRENHFHMMANEKRNPKLMTLATILILGIGAFLRLYHLGVVGFSSPWTLGGLYLEFSRQIFLNHYALPTTISRL